MAGNPAKARIAQAIDFMGDILQVHLSCLAGPSLMSFIRDYIPRLDVSTGLAVEAYTTYIKICSVTLVQFT